MVFQKRLDYGFSGYQVPPMPRAPRSVRRRRSFFKKKVDDDQMCAIDLLATLAGKILVEGEKSVGVGHCGTGNTKNEQLLFDKSQKVEPCDTVSYQRSYQSTNHSQVHNPESALKISPPFEIHSWSGLTNSSSSNKAYNDLGLASKIKSVLLDLDINVEPEAGKQMKLEPVDAVLPAVGVEAGTYNCSKYDVQDREPLPHDDSAAKKVPCYEDRVLHGTSLVKIVSKDDDERSSGCTRPSNQTKLCRSSPPRIVDRRIRKFLAYKYWNVAPKLKDGELHNTDVDKQPVYQNRKSCFRHQRSQRNYPFKKRKMFYHGSYTNSSQGTGGKHDSRVNRDAFDSGIGTPTPSSLKGESASFKRKDSHVKLRIKSFRVPELFVEISEMATIGSLKRMVMEAVTAILGGGLRVGVLFHGKKIGDDNRTLLQTGITHDNQLDSIGFSLEPNTSQNMQPHSNGNSFHMLPAQAPQPLKRYMPPDVSRGISDMLLDPPVRSVGNFVESDHDSAPSPDLSIDRCVADCKAMVPMPPMKMDIISTPPPVHRTSKHSEAAQRRIRRPFSVSEVEALVQAVEKLGTGRWRDVKLQAFDNAKHRTYVDLKDKWKTLVHTAKISPQQRRGEPVPQELLNRVLNAHAYWSLQQAKQQVKHQRETRLFLELEPMAATEHNRN